MHIYLSTTQGLGELATRFEAGLKEFGHVSWRPGSSSRSKKPVSRQIEDRMRRSDAVVFLIGKDAEATAWTSHEWSSALEVSWADPANRLVSVLVGGATAPSFLKGRQAVRLQDPVSGFNRALKRLSTILETPQPEQKQPIAPRSPKGQRQRLDKVKQQAERTRPTREELEQQAANLKQQLDREVAEKDPSLPDTAARLADLLTRLGQTQAGLAPLDLAISYLSKQAEPDAERLGRLHSSAGSRLSGLHRHTDARRHFESSVDFYEQAHGRDGLPGAFARLRLAGTLAQLGDEQNSQKHRRLAFNVMGRRTKRFLEQSKLGRGILRFVKGLQENADKQGSTSKKRVTKKRAAKKKTAKRADARPAAKQSVGATQPRASKKAKTGRTVSSSVAAKGNRATKKLSKA
jgi:tetratricopeptide (TPR) repeat protein